MQYPYFTFYIGCQPHHLHWPFSGIYCPCLHLHVSPQGLPGGKAEGDPLEHGVLSFYWHWTHQICWGFGALLGWLHPLPTLLLQDVSWNNPAGSIQRTCSSTSGPLQIRTKNAAKRCNFFRDSPQQGRPFPGFRGEGRVIVMNQYFINYHLLIITNCYQKPCFYHSCPPNGESTLTVWLALPSVPPVQISGGDSSS